MTATGRRTWRRTARGTVTALAVAAPFLAVTPSVRAAASAPAPVLVAPMTGGPVDFGDRVAYRLRGSRCATERVAVEVATRRVVRGTASQAAADPLRPGECIGVATVPAEAAVRGAGWDGGDPVAIAVVGRTGRVDLRYQRLEVEHGRAVRGAPHVVTPAVRDPRGGARDRAVELRSGDVIELGTADLSRIDSVSLRLCVTMPKPHAGPSVVELRAGSPDGPAFVGPVDVGNDYPIGAPHTKSHFGWPNCWQLQPWPVTGPVHARAPRLYLALVASASPVQFSWVDLNGTGAKVPDEPPPDPPGTERIFDGTSWRGWTTSGCVLDDDGSVRNAPDNAPTGYLANVTFGFVGPSGCRMDYTARKLRDVVVRLEFRMRSFTDNGGVFIGGREVQLRQAGEWMTGGLMGDPITAANDWRSPDELDGVIGDSSGGGYPAERLKVSSYPDWNQLEIVQLGARHTVRLNGRTVSDSATAWPAPEPFTLGIASQPQFSHHVDVGTRMDSPYVPTITQPAEWGNVAFRNVRVYRCTTPRDAVCTGGPGIRG